MDGRGCASSTQLVEIGARGGGGGRPHLAVGVRAHGHQNGVDGLRGVGALHGPVPRQGDEDAEHLHLREGEGAGAGEGCDHVVERAVHDGLVVCGVGG